MLGSLTYLVYGATVSLNASLYHLAVVPGTTIFTSIHSLLNVFNAKLIFCSCRSGVRLSSWYFSPIRSLVPAPGGRWMWSDGGMKTGRGKP
jgi:hypothetical protein